MPTVNNTIIDDLTSEQIKALLNAIDKDSHPQAGALMKMVLATGMRRGELFNLQWTDVDFDRGWITIRTSKGGKDKKIPLNDTARSILENHKRTDSLYVFPDSKGNKLKQITREVRSIRDKAGLPNTFRPLQGLRHYFASNLTSTGEVDIYTLQKLLTHKSPLMTQRYAHLSEGALKRASNLAGKVFRTY